MNGTIPDGSGVGVVRVDPSVANQDSSVDVGVEKVEPVLTTVEKEKERSRDINSTDEEVLRLMHPSIVAGEFSGCYLEGHLY